MKKIVSFSLYGIDGKYTLGMLCNVELCKIIYPDWICRIYCGVSVPEYIVNELKSYDNTEVIIMDETSKHSFMMWRFLAIDDDDVEIMICRDADSRLSYREKECVDQFISSDSLLHSIQDHHLHDNIMGGMWGMKKNDRIVMSELIDKWYGGLEYFSDQAFIREIIKPIYVDSLITHCSTYLQNFPKSPDNPHFVGEVFPDNNHNQPRNYIFY